MRTDVDCSITVETDYCSSAWIYNQAIEPILCLVQHLICLESDNVQSSGLRPGNGWMSVAWSFDVQISLRLTQRTLA